MTNKAALASYHKICPKKALLLYLSLFLVLACAQSVPKKANDNFLKKFKGAKDIEWKRGPKSGWVVSF
ncbi:hypothetical protein [Pareuzebyella sediminis]|uniref:hypothetical protein n=1 Tax=Pareuzebyella sediminis TaxID=2607998 RepID=UPI0011EFC39E|nr:hypothetical protein [Pareuzebyella sediminis]